MPPPHNGPHPAADTNTFKFKSARGAAARGGLRFCRRVKGGVRRTDIKAAEAAVIEGYFPAQQQLGQVVRARSPSVVAAPHYPARRENPEVAADVFELDSPEDEGF